MNLKLRYGLPFVSLEVGFRGKSALIDLALIDTGSASTIFGIDFLGPIGVYPEPTDALRTIRVVGGTEEVFRKTLDFVSLSDRRLKGFTAEIGAMDYGFEIHGIIGKDLLPIQAILAYASGMNSMPTST